MDTAKHFSLSEISERLNLPSAWLRREADEGRLPMLLVGRRRMFDLGRVSRVLAERQDCHADSEPEADEAGAP